MPPRRMISWTQAKVVVGEPNGPWGAGGKTYDGVRLELLDNRQTRRLEARLFDRAGFEVLAGIVTEHSVDGPTAIIRTAEGDTWTASKLGDCGCG